MNTEEFIEAIKEVVVNSAIKSVQSKLFKPPGRNPSEKLTMMSEWYTKLSDGDKSIVIRIIEETVQTSVFGFLCVLDGVRSIENGDKGELKLYYEKGKNKILLNDTEKVNLHELL
jgi:hypothetical protein